MASPIDYSDTIYRILAAVLHAIRSLLQSRVEVSIENAALRHQLAVLKAPFRSGT